MTVSSNVGECSNVARNYLIIKDPRSRHGQIPAHGHVRKIHGLKSPGGDSKCVAGMRIRPMKYSMTPAPEHRSLSYRTPWLERGRSCYCRPGATRPQQHQSVHPASRATRAKPRGVKRASTVCKDKRYLISSSLVLGNNGLVCRHTPPALFQGGLGALLGRGWPMTCHCTRLNDRLRRSHTTAHTHAPKKALPESTQAAESPTSPYA